MTKIIHAYELLEQKVSKTHIANHIGVSRRTVIRWAQGIERLWKPGQFPGKLSTSQERTTQETYN